MKFPNEVFKLSFNIAGAEYKKVRFLILQNLKFLPTKIAANKHSLHSPLLLTQKPQSLCKRRGNKQVFYVLAMALSSTFSYNFCLKSKSSQSQSNSVSAGVNGKAGLPLKQVRTKVFMSNPLIVNQTQTKVSNRRIGDHHPNLWADDFIQSLPNHPYQARSHFFLLSSLVSLLSSSLFY